MRTLSILVSGCALALAAATVSISGLLSTLERLIEHDVIRVETLVRGDLHELYLMPLVWQNVACLLTAHWWAPFFALTAFLPMLLIRAVIASACYRRRYTNYTAAGLASLLSASLPWLLGVVMLARIQGPQEAGRWVLMMLGSVFRGSLVCAAGAGWHLASTRRVRNAEVMVSEAVA